MAIPCQKCGVRPAVAARGNYSHSHKRGRRFSRSDHDMCRQCWASDRDSRIPVAPRGRLDGLLDDLMTAAGLEVRRSA